MAKSGHTGKPANQGSAGKANVQKPRTSSKPSAKSVEPKQTPQDKRRGIHTPGNKGTGKGAR